MAVKGGCRSESLQIRKLNAILIIFFSLFKTFGLAESGIWDVDWLGIEILLQYQVHRDWVEKKGRREKFRDGEGRKGLSSLCLNQYSFNI